jgi:hypothetical protein
VADEPSGEHPRALSRHALEHVIARAVELSLAETDAEEQVSEDELVRIAEELGLSARHVKQALYERPPEDRPVGFLDLNFGSESVTVVRSVPHDQPIVLSRLEEYLVTREYLQLRRRQGMNAYFEPAEDAFSSIARAFSRPSGRFHLARTQRAYLTVRPLESGWSHIRLEVCYPDQRRARQPRAWWWVVSLVVCWDPWRASGRAPFSAAGAVGHGARSFDRRRHNVRTISLGWSVAKAQFRKFMTRSREEADALLDRLEQGEAAPTSIALAAPVAAATPLWLATHELRPFQRQPIFPPAVFRLEITERLEPYG